MDSIRAILVKLFPLIVPIYILSACNKNDNPIIQNNHWQTIYQNNDLYLYSIKFLDKNYGVVMAETDAVHGESDWKFVLSTEDGGNIWNQITCSTIDTTIQFPLYDIGFVHLISKNVLLATGYNVHKSTDNGKTWINVSPHWAGASINDLYVIDSLTWLVAKGTEIYRTNDAGQTWQNVFHTDFMGALERFSFPSPNVGFINDGVVDMDHNLSAGLIVKTIDGGQSWTILKPEPWNSNNIILPYVVAMQFNNDKEGYLSTLADSKLFKTLDGGNNWELVNNNRYTNGLQYFITGQIGYSSDGITIYVTNNGGKTWQIDYYNNDTDSDILTWTFLKNGQGFAITRDHRIIKNINLPN
jgi:photosystem II stability/assembly factor-like uncharacterized protein